MMTEYLYEILIVAGLPVYASFLRYVYLYEKKAAFDNEVQKPWY